MRRLRVKKKHQVNMQKVPKVPKGVRWAFSSRFPEATRLKVRHPETRAQMRTPESGVVRMLTSPRITGMVDLFGVRNGFQTYALLEDDIYFTILKEESGKKP